MGTECQLRTPRGEVEPKSNGYGMVMGRGKGQNFSLFGECH